MYSKFRIATGLALLLALSFVIPAFAGGWAVITLDELPMNIVAGEPVTVGFTVLQHGRTPMDGLTPTIVANLHKEQEFTVNAVPDGKPGHYTATLTFPKEGEWRWYVNAFSMEQLMPMLTVAAPAGGVVSQPAMQSEPATATFPALTLVRLSALGVGLVGLAVAFRRRSRLAVALTGLCLLVGVASFMFAPAVPEVEAQSKSSSEEAASAPSSISQAELGSRLFIAKGCITCHAHGKVTSASEYWVITAGPDLTYFSASPEALFMRLKDPSSVKSDTQMPNLDLTEVEINALIAFINSD